jgi:hypothetical protein
MKILSYLLDKIGIIWKRKPSGLNLKTLKLIFEDECAFCDAKIDYSNLVAVEDKNVPCCLYCKALNENGTRWTSILKRNYENEKRRYCDKYLRIMILFSDVD